MCDPVTGATRRRPSGRRAGTTLFKRPTRPTQSLPPHRIEPLESRRLLSAAPLRPDLLASSDSGVSDADDLTRFDNATPAVALQFLVAGTTPGAAVSLWLGGVSVATATAAGPGTLLTLDPAVRVADGTHAVTARQTDPDGEPSPASPALSFTVDTTAPAAPAAPDLQPASDTGTSNSDDVTSDNTPTFTAAGAPYYRLLRDGTRVSAAYESGSAVTAPTLADGVHAFTLESIDAAGNVSAASSPLQVTVDTAAPAAALDPGPPLPPAVLLETGYEFSVAYTDPSGVDEATIDGTDVNITGPGFSNTGTLAQRVGLTSNASGTRLVATYRFTAPGGSWDSADNGSYFFNLRPSQVRDAAGNFAAGAVLGRLPVNLPPFLAAPTLLPATDSGVSNADALTHFDNSTPARAPSFVIRNTVRGATITVFAGGVAIGSATADGSQTVVTGNGALALPDGEHAITAEETLDGRRLVPPSPALRLTIDTVAPPPPQGLDLQAASDSGIRDDDDLTNDNTPTLDVAGADPYFRVFRDGALVSNPFVSGTWFISAPLADGVHRFTAATVDAAGNASEQTPPLEVTVDTAAPAAGGIAGALDASFDGDGRLIPEAGSAWNSAAVQSDGKVVFVGAVGPELVVTRLNADGSADPSFGTNGRSSLGTGERGYIAVLPDDRIVVAGLRGVWRLSASGTVDPTFAAGGTTMVDFAVRNLAVAPDGKLLLTGLQDANRFGVARLTPDGAFDTTFGGTGQVVTAPGQPSGYPYAVAGTADGRVVVSGYAYTSGAPYSAVVMRFSDDGSPDHTFGTRGLVVYQRFAPRQSYAAKVDVAPDGSVTLFGVVESQTLPEHDTTFLARLKPDGTPDTTFGSAGLVTVGGRGTGGRVSPDGYFIATWHGGQIRATRYDNAGRVDPTVPGGVVTSSSGTGNDPAQFHDYAVAPDGDVILVGIFDPPGAGVRLAAFRLHGLTLGVPDLQAASDSGSSATDNLTNDNTPTFDVAASEAQRHGYLRVYRDGAVVGGAYEPVEPFTAPPQPDGKWNYATSFVDAAGNVSAPAPALAVTVDTAAPRVAELFASTFSWTDAFTAALAAAGIGGTSGFKLPAAEPAASPATLPWSNVNHFTFRMSEPVVVRQADLAVDGDATGPYAVSGFFRDTAGRTATWMLDRALSADEVRLALADTVTDTAGNRLAGTETDTGGEAGAATPFQARLRVAPGDANRSGAVDALDLVSTRARLFTTPGGAGPRRYSVFNDFNGDGRINATDYHLVRTRLTARRRDLPPPAPDAPAPVAPQSTSVDGRRATATRRTPLLHESADAPLLPR